MSFQDVETGSSFQLRKDSLDSKPDASQTLAGRLFEINTSVSTFKRLVNTLGTPKDTPDFREKLHKTRQHIGQLTKEAAAKLKAASETDYVTEVGAGKKLADAKLAKDFQAVLTEFQKAQRIAAERETAYAPFVPQAVLPSTYTAGELNFNDGDRYNQEQRALLIEQRRQEVFLLENETTFNEAVIEEREEGIREIQQQIGEVNEIFKDLAVLVREQGIMIDDVDSNIEGSHAETIQANTQLSMTAKSQKSRSSLVCLILVIFVVVLLVVIIVIAT